MPIIDFKKYITRVENTDNKSKKTKHLDAHLVH